MRRGRNNNENASPVQLPQGKRLAFNVTPIVQGAGRRLAFNGSPVGQKLVFNGPPAVGAGAGGGGAAAPEPLENFNAPPPPPAEPTLLPYSNDMENSFYTFDKCFRIDGQYYHLVRPGGEKGLVTAAAIPTEKYNSIAELLDHPGVYTYMLFEDNTFSAAKALNPGEVLSKHKNLHRNSGGKRVLLAGEILVRPNRTVIFNFISGTYMPHIARRFTQTYPGTDATTFFSNALRERLIAAGAAAVEFDPRVDEVASMISLNSTEAAIAPFLGMDPPYTRHGPYPDAAACMAARVAGLQQGGGKSKHEEAIAVFAAGPVQGEAVAEAKGRDTILKVKFTKLPPGDHGFHIHRAGDMRSSVKIGRSRFSLNGCKGACSHFHKGRPANHGPAPGSHRTQRHTGDLGNISMRRPQRRYTLRNLRPSELFGRSLIVHADRDDLGLGDHDDSLTTGHSGARIGCAIFGRGMGCK